MKLARSNRCSGCWALLVALAGMGLLMPPRLAAAEEAPAEQAAAREVDTLLGELDDAEFAARSRAAARLAELAGEPALGRFLAARFRLALMAQATSFEVRTQLESLLRKLPPPPPLEAKPTESQIAPLVEALQSDVYAERDSAVRRLKDMLTHADLIGPLWLEFKRRSADPALPASARHALAPLLRAAHEAWLRASPDKVPLPMPPAEQIEAWINDVAPLGEFVNEGRETRRVVHRELLDLIARDDTRGFVLAMLQERIAADRDSVGQNALKDLVEFAKPGMVAEVWSNQSLRTVQYLTIGVPQFNETAIPPKATHFDRIDDRSAHCVSGNSLTEGDYPVGVAIPHPEPGNPTMFYLSNLSTPRRRLAYEYRIERDPAVLIQEMTERTLQFYLNRQAPLAENEILLLGQLEPRAVSRFIGHYFETVPDVGLIPTPGGLNTSTSVYGGICAVASRMGTHDAVPALDKLARGGALGKLTFANRVDAPWVAALAIAERDPWLEVDDWLAKLLDERAPLTADPDRPPELGASAAGLLLDRHGVSTRPFGLEPAGESVTENFRFSGYRFTSERARQDVKHWWQKQQQLAAAAKAAGLGGTSAASAGVRARLRNTEPSQP